MRVFGNVVPILDQTIATGDNVYKSQDLSPSGGLGSNGSYFTGTLPTPDVQYFKAPHSVTSTQFTGEEQNVNAATTATFHVRINVATDGQDNLVDFALFGQVAGAGGNGLQLGGANGLVFNSYDIQVEGYNTKLNWSETGNDDSVILVNAQNQIISL